MTFQTFLNEGNVFNKMYQVLRKRRRNNLSETTIEHYTIQEQAQNRDYSLKEST